MRTLLVTVIALVSSTAVAMAGAFGLSGVPSADGYMLKLDTLPTCTSCYAYWDLRWHFDEDGIDPDFAGETRWAVAVQIGRHRGDAPGTMRIKVWDNLTGTGVTQVVAVADPHSVVTVWLRYDNPWELDIGWRTPAGDSVGRTYTFPWLEGTQPKRAIAQARLSTANAFAGWVRLYEEGYNFVGATPIKKQEGCTRLKTDIPRNELHITCTRPARR